jgi:hypothetical protein
VALASLTLAAAAEVYILLVALVALAALVVAGKAELLIQTTQQQAAPILVAVAEDREILVIHLLRLAAPA